MPQWAGSSWYFLRYCDPKNGEALASKEALEYWMPVDWYNGGMEHVTRHMIYSRFWHHFLYDIGAVPHDEPYAKRTAQGLILGPDGEKMSKSKGNVVDPNDVVDEYGADVLRTYTLFMGDYGSAAPWSQSSVRGCKRFLERFAALDEMLGKEDEKLVRSLHKTIKKVSQDIDGMKFNTAIAAMMSFLNDVYAVGTIDKTSLLALTRILCPFAPHVCEEMWANLGMSGFCSTAEWPSYDEALTVDNEIEIAVQVCGKLKGTVVIPAGAEEDVAWQVITENANIMASLEGKQIIKKIYIKDKIFNIVAK
jgi:leucyl-tRNA synthetase